MGHRRHLPDRLAANARDDRVRRVTFPPHVANLGGIAGEPRRGEAEEEERSGFFSRLRDSLGKSCRALTEQLALESFDAADDEAGSVSKKRLIAADVGPQATASMCSGWKPATAWQPRRGARRGGWEASHRTGGRGSRPTTGPAWCSSSASTARGRRRRSASWRTKLASRTLCRPRAGGHTSAAAADEQL